MFPLPTPAREEGWEGRRKEGVCPTGAGVRGSHSHTETPQTVHVPDLKLQTRRFQQCLRTHFFLYT